MAGFSLLTKYVIRYRGSHVFNPSNFGLVVAFIVLGSTRIEPLDFWWAPLDLALLAAYAVIIGGGLLITRRLKLLALAASFWLSLGGRHRVLAGSGHCMTANWSFAPVCGFDFWRIIVTSPEVLIFLFFMITDPKTVPGGRVGRVAFGILVAVASTLLIAPQTDEFGTKVALLSGLVLMCAVRPLLDRFLPEPKSAADEFGRFATRLATGGSGSGAGMRAWGGPSRAHRDRRAGDRGRDRRGRHAGSRDVRAGLGVGSDPRQVPHQIDPATFPAITVAPDVIDFDHEMAGPAAQALVLTLAENLELENQALLRGDDTILTAVDHGDRLDEMRARLQVARDTGRTTIDRYAIDDVDIRLIVPFGRQDGLSMGLDSTGTVTHETYDASGALVGTETTPFEQTFVMRRATGGRWLNVAVLPPGVGG